MIGVSVIICCYNSSALLPKTLAHIAAQKTYGSFKWEVILINNASTDDTVDIANEEWAKYDLPSVEFRIIEQPVPGLSFARAKGIGASLYEYLIFCDDDNWLSENYIQTAYQTMQGDKRIGVLGGWGIAEPEIEPEKWIDLTVYATGKQSPTSGDVTHTKTTVYGAGSIYRKSALTFLHEKGFRPYLSDRKGDILTSGGDAELCWAISLAGYKIWYDENLKFFHYLPKKRLNFEYLKRMEFGNGYSSALHVPYYELISKSVRPAHKNTWYWRFFSMLPIFFNQKFDSKKKNNKHDQLTLIRTKGIVLGLWKQRNHYKKLSQELKFAKWIKR